MSTGARGGGRGRGRGRGQGRGRGRGRGANKAPASTEAFVTAVEDNSVSTPAAPAPQQQKKKDVTMTEKTVNNNNNNKTTGKKPNNKPAAAAAPAPAAPAPAAPAKTNNNNKNNKNRKRGRQEAENGDVPIVEANETASPKEDNTPVEPPAKRQRTENGNNNFRKRPPRQQKPRDENWEPGNAHMKGETSQMTILDTPADATVEEIEELIKKETGIRPTQVRVIPRAQRQRNQAQSQPQPQPGKTHITFETPEQATTAVEKLRGLQYKGNELKTQYSKEVKMSLNEEYSGISPVLKLYDVYGTTYEDIINAINKYCTNVPEKIFVKRIFTKGYDYGVASINTGDVEVAKRMKKELEGKLIKDQTPLIGFWAQPWKLNQGQEQEEMQVDNE